MSKLPVKKREIPPLTSENWEHRTHTSQNSSTGLYETHDILTGDLLCVEKDIHQDHSATDFIEVTLDGKTFHVEKGVDYSRLVSRKQYVYSREWLDILCTRIMEGRSLTSVLSDSDMPSVATVSKWRDEYKEIETAIKAAYEWRGEYHRDQVQKIIDVDAQGRDEIENKKIKIDGHKWLAGKDHPTRFGVKKEEGGGPKAPVFIINTGIERKAKEVQEIKEVIDVGEEESS